MVQIIELLGNKSGVKILSLFLKNPTLQTHQKDIQKRVKLAKATLIRGINVLVENKILSFIRFGRTKVYSLNRKNKIVKHLKILDNLLLISEIRDIVAEDAQMYLYGSSARGEDVEDSDMDILIIGKIRKEQIIQKINELSEKIRRKIKVEIFSPQEWSQMAKKDPAFYERVEKDKIEL